MSVMTTEGGDLNGRVGPRPPRAVGATNERSTGRAQGWTAPGQRPAIVAGVNGRSAQFRTGRSTTDLHAPEESFVRLLYAEYAGLLMLVAMRLTGGDRQWAEDVVQETFVRAWQHANRLLRERRSRNLMPWLVTVARRIVINDWRARAARPPEVDDAALLLIAVPDDTDQVLQRLVLREALEVLTPMHRRVVVEMFLRGHTVDEVARIVGVPPGTVKSRVFNAMRVMRAAMSTRGVTFHLGKET